MRYLVHFTARFGSYSNDILYEKVLQLLNQNIEVDLLVCKLKKSACHINYGASAVKCKMCHLATNSFIKSLPSI